MSQNAPQKRPLTQREIRRRKQDAEEVERIVIINRSSSQSIPIQLKAPDGVDFFVGEQTVMLYPKKMAKFPKNRLYTEQINNFCKQGRVRILDAS